MTTLSKTVSLSQKFGELRTAGKRALVCYLTAGHPDRARSLETLRAVAESGADVIEIGVPFSDPMADGPVIQASSQMAIENGMHFDGVLELVAEANISIPVVLFSYLNPVMAAGKDALVRIKESGIGGILITDLPVGSDPERESWLGESGLEFVRLVAPTTPEERMREIARHGSGFVYLISRLGVTGMQSEVSKDLPATVERLRRSTTLPICIGFGVSNGAQARTVASLGDGVVVGSALVKAAGDGVEAAAKLTRELREALDR